MSKIKVQEIEHTTSSTPAITIAQNNDVTCNAGLTATSFTGDGANLTNLPVDLTQLNAQNLTSGIIPDARFGTIPDAAFPATLPAVSGANLTGVSAGALEYVTEQRVLGSDSVNSLEFDETIIEPNQEYFMVGLINLNISYSPTLCIATEMEDTSGTIYGYQSGYNSCFTKTYGSTGYSNQTSSYWYLYDGGYNAQVINFQMRLSTKKYPRMQYWGHGVSNEGSNGYYMVEVMVCASRYRPSTGVVC